jgi:excisionase family DNA binding protein
LPGGILSRRLAYNDGEQAASEDHAMTRTKTQAAARSTKPARSKNNTPAAEPSEVLTLAEAAAYLRVVPEAVVRMVDTQGLPGRQFGTEWRFLKAALQGWLSTPQGSRGLLAQLGKAKDDPYLQEMLASIYARRGRPQTEEG